MQIVTDSGTDYQLSSLENENHENIHVVPLSVTLKGRTYTDGVAVQHLGISELPLNIQFEVVFHTKQLKGLLRDL